MKTFNSDEIKGGHFRKELWCFPSIVFCLGSRSIKVHGVILVRCATVSLTGTTAFSLSFVQVETNDSDYFNPTTPVPPVTGRREPWLFFHFWRRHICPKLASSKLNFCRRKRSFHWSPDQSDRPNGAWDPEICTKMLKKMREKLRAKFPQCYYT